MDLRELGRGDMDWVDKALDGYNCRALVNTVINLLVPLYFGKLSNCTTHSFLRRT
jgi:hypothetical protein